MKTDLFNNINVLLPESGKKAFSDVVKSQMSSGKSETEAIQVGWSVVKKRLKKSENGWLANSADFEVPSIYTFEIDVNNNSFLFNDENGEVVFEAILASTTPNNDGVYLDVEDLNSIADQINERGSTLPDVQHENYKEILSTYIGVPAEQINHSDLYQKMINKKGIFKEIKAAVKDGKLWVRGFLDKRYKKQVSSFKSVSIEAIGKQRNGRLMNPTYLGFTFTNSPKLPEAALFA